MNETPKYDLFISYRRDGGVDYARMIFLELKGRGYNAFFDYNSLRDGKFNEGIFKAIEECRYFILVLSSGSLDRCMSEDDWVRHEIEYALSENKVIIPVCPSGCMRGFPAKMPESFEPLRNLQISMLQMDDLFEKSFDKIVEDRFDAEFREGRAPISVSGGVTSKVFKRIGIGVIVAIIAASGIIGITTVRSREAEKARAEQSRRLTENMLSQAAEEKKAADAAKEKARLDAIAAQKEQARVEAEMRAKEKVEAEAKVQALKEETARKEREEQARKEAEKREAELKFANEERMRLAAEAKAKEKVAAELQAVQKEQMRLEAEMKAKERSEAELRALREAAIRAEAEVKAVKGVSGVSKTGNSGPMSVERGTKERALYASALSKLKEGRRLKAVLKNNGWNTSERRYVEADLLEAQVIKDLRDGNFEVTVTNASNMLEILLPMCDMMAEKKLLEIEAELDDLDLSDDRRLSKKLELIKEIVPISVHNKKVLMAKSDLEDVLYPRMKVTALYEGKEVPAKFTLGIPLCRDGECGFCGNSEYCGACKNNPRWLRVCSDYKPGSQSLFGQVYHPGTKISTAKDGLIYAQKNDVIGVVRVEYSTRQGVCVGQTERIVANWIGETNVVICLGPQQQYSPGEVRVVRFADGTRIKILRSLGRKVSAEVLAPNKKIEFVWCPPGSFSFEYRIARSAPVKIGQISVKKGFWISKYEVTCEQANAAGCFDNPVQPMVGSSDMTPARFTTGDACRFVEEVNKAIGEGARVRLPTASEWEYAARCNNVMAIDGENVNEYGWVAEVGIERQEKDAIGRDWRYHDVGGKKCNGIGLFDMYGNAEEWAEGTVDAELGLKIHNPYLCQRCDKVMSLHGGSVRTSTTNAVIVLTRDYMRNRQPDLDRMGMPDLFYTRNLYNHNDSVNPFAFEREDGNVKAGIRLVADELPPELKD